MIKHFLAAFLALMLPVSAMADGAFWTGGALGGAGSGGVSSSATLSLDVGTKLVFDADGTANDYLVVNTDGILDVWVTGVRRGFWNASGLLVNDNYGYRLGNSADYDFVYDSASTRLELNSINVDGVPNPGIVFKVDDGTDDVDFSGDITLPVGGKLVLDGDATANDYIYTTSDGVMRIAPSNAIISTLTSTYQRYSSGIENQFGSSNSFHFVYDGSNTQFEFNSSDCGGATPCTLLSVDDGDAIFDLRNDEFFHNEQDGKITLGGGGGTNNEDLVLDFETTANRVIVTSNTGANLLELSGISLLASQLYSNLYNSSSGISVGGFNYDTTQDDIMFTTTSAFGNQWVFGPGAHYAKDFDHAAQTNPTIYVHSDTDPDSDNTQWLSLHHNVTEGRIETGTGKIALGGIGQTNNEDLVLDFETSSNIIFLTSNTGVATLGMTNFLVGARSLRANSGEDIYWNLSTELVDPANGQLTIRQDNETTGATLDVLTADTLTIKDQAGTAAGNLALMSGGKMILDGDADSNNYLDATDALVTMVVENASNMRWTSSGAYMFDSRYFGFGTGAGGVPDQNLAYTDGTGVQWNDGTNDVITIPDDTGIVETNVGRRIATRIIDVDDSPYTVLATDEVIVVDTDSGTGAPAAVTVNLPAAACGITIGGTEKDSCRIIRIKNIGGTSNVTVDANGAEEIDNATTATLTPEQSITLIDTNQTDYHWIIE